MTERMSQPTLAIRLRTLVDAARYANPITGKTSSSSRATLRNVLERYPDWSRQSHVLHNLGKRRTQWLKAFEETMR